MNDAAERGRVMTIRTFEFWQSIQRQIDLCDGAAGADVLYLE